MKLAELQRRGVVSMLDKSVWTSLSRDDISTLNYVSTVALPPVLYEEIRAELAPRKKRKAAPTDRLAAAASKANSYRTYPLPTAWQLVQAELGDEDCDGVSWRPRRYAIHLR